ncbi:uncharacterized protein METZ01_LOCUS416263, partial [marine metagenome]
QSTVKEKYFEPSYSLDPPGVGEGLDLLRSLIPNLTSLDLSGSYIEELDLEKFINLQELNISYCDELHTVTGLEKLDKLTSLNCSFTSINLDVDKLELIPDIIGLRNKYGMYFGGNVQEKEEIWWEYLDEFLDNEFQQILENNDENVEDYLGSNIDVVIEESDFYEVSFESNRYFFKPLEDYLSKEKMECLPNVAKDEVAVFLFHDGWDFITSFTRHHNDFTVDCDECYGTFTVGETVQVDEFDESIRCCSECAKEREN